MYFVDIGLVEFYCFWICFEMCFCCVKDYGRNCVIEDSCLIVFSEVF